MTIETLKPFLASIDGLVATSENDKGTYVHPALRNLGAVSLVLIREIVAPAVFRNTEQEITDIDVPTPSGPLQAVRAVPNKFKHRERARGLQILRHFGVGGRFPQNRYNIKKKEPISEVFDINSFVFGDSVYLDGKVFPVKAAALYSDGISTVEYGGAVDSATHNRASEDGSLFDAEKKQNSSALFDRHFVKPGTLLVQTVSTIGKVMPPELLDHLLLTIGAGGVYGGQTSISGVNVRTHVAGVFAGKVETPETSPYVLAGEMLANGGVVSVKEACEEVSNRLAPIHAASVTGEEAGDYVRQLCSRLEADDPKLREQYEGASSKVAQLFSEWFTGKAA